MPRVSPALLRIASAIDPLLAQLLPVCRDLPSARSELRWIREHAKHSSSSKSAAEWRQIVQQYALRRSHGEPLQYILGCEWFGDLEIRCRKHVLIPRQETAISITHLVDLLSSRLEYLPKRLQVLDLCTGSGCIPLLFQHEFYAKLDASRTEAAITLDLIGVDISTHAIKLARENQAVQLKQTRLKAGTRSLQAESLESMRFLRANVLHKGETGGSIAEASSLPQVLLGRDPALQQVKTDILISNPPYISSSDYWHKTAHSVRHYEPKLALVPPNTLHGQRTAQDGDDFYNHIFATAKDFDSKICLVEVADLTQAKRVALMATQQGIWDGVEIWRDDPTAQSPETPDTLIHGQGCSNCPIPIMGSGAGRSVIAYRWEGGEWVGRAAKRIR